MIRKKIKPALKDDVLGQHCQNLKIEIEKLQTQKINSMHTENLEIDNRLDLEFKLRSYPQTGSF